MLEAVITGIISGLIVAIVQFFLIRWLDKQMEKRSFKFVMNKMRENCKKKEKEVHEAGGSMSDFFRIIWEDLT